MGARGARAAFVTRDIDNGVVNDERLNAHPLSVLIAEADNEALSLYEGYASLHSGVSVGAICATTDEAIDALQGDAYDIVVLGESADIDVWRIIDEIGIANMPPTIIVSTSEAGAVKAFDRQVADYLVTPVCSERFTRALDNAIGRINHSSDQRAFASLVNMLSSLKGSANRPSRFLVHDKRKYSFIQAADIDWVEAADNYVILHVGDKQYFVRDTMSSMESRLEGERFMRIHRSAIINIDSVKSVEPWSGTEFRFVLNDGTTLISGRRFRDRLKSVLLRG